MSRKLPRFPRRWDTARTGDGPCPLKNVCQLQTVSDLSDVLHATSCELETDANVVSSAHRPLRRPKNGNIHRSLQVYKPSVTHVCLPYPTMSTPSRVQSDASSLTVPASRPPMASSPHGSESSLNRVKDLPGYTTPIFKGKEEQRAAVEQEVANKARSSFQRDPHRSGANVQPGLHTSRTRRRRG